jgi:hypothetical protein
MPVASLLRAVVRHDDQMLDADPDGLLAAGASVHLRARDLANGEPLALSPGGGHADRRAGRLELGALSCGAVASGHLGSILSAS